MNTERLHDVIQAVGPDFHGLSYRERLIVGAVLKHLSTPPADDVREAVARLSGHVFHGEYFKRPATVVEISDLRLVLDVLAAAEIRQRGTVSDAEVDAAARAFWSHPVEDGDRAAVRAALEAAREVRS